MVPPVLAQRAASEGDGEATGMVSVLAEPPRWSSGRSMRAVKGSLGHSSWERRGELAGALGMDEGAAVGKSTVGRIFQAQGKEQWEISSIALFEDLSDKPPSRGGLRFPRRSTPRAHPTIQHWPLNIKHSARPSHSHSDRLGRSKKVEWPLFTRQRILQRRHVHFFSGATMQRLMP